MVAKGETKMEKNKSNLPAIEPLKMGIVEEVLSDGSKAHNLQIEDAEGRVMLHCVDQRSANRIYLAILAGTTDFK
jgi:hypothetical protein